MSGELKVDTRYKTVYSPSFLTIFYDKYVLGFNMKYMWGCATNDVLVPFFCENFSRNHLDCGVATGFFPAKALSRPFRASSKQRLTVLDLTTPPLNATRARVLAVAPAVDVSCVEADVTEPPPKELLGERFDSISMFNLFHCMPGGKGKLRAFGAYKELLTDDGVLVGCTVLGPADFTPWYTKMYLKLYNRTLGVFNNWEDNKEDIEEALNQEFDEVETWIIGNMMLFRAKKPKQPLLNVA